MVRVTWDLPVWLQAAEDSHLAVLSDLELRSIDGTPVLYGTTRGGGGLVAYRLAENDLVRVDSASYTSTFATGQDSRILLDSIGDTLSLAVTGVNGTGLWLFEIAANGGFPVQGRVLAGAILPRDLIQAATVEARTGQVLLGLTHGSDKIHLWQIGEDDRLAALPAQSARLGGPDETLIALGTGMAGGETFVLALSDGGDILSSYKVLEDGQLGLAGRHRQEDGLGIGTPVALRTVELDGETYVLVAAQDSNSISVFRLTATGRLDPVDHLLDSPETRFGHVNSIEVTVSGGSAYVAASGNEDGVSLLQLLPGGRLLHLTTLADSLETGLAHVSAVALSGTRGRLGLAVASATEPGLTWLTADLGPGGLSVTEPDTKGVLRGTSRNDVLVSDESAERLIAGGGDDILVDGGGTDTMSGGSGRDVFVLSADGSMDLITDFQPGIDRLDLSGWTFLRNAGQLTFYARPDGIDIAFRNELLRVRSETGEALTSGYVLSSGFLDGDRFLPDWSEQARIMAAASSGGGEDDEINGAQGRDRLVGGAGDDRLFGRGGDDTLDGGTGADYMNGGPGSDRIIVDDAGDRVAESRKWDGHDTVESSVDFRMGRKHIEDLELTGDARLGAGNGLTNRITGNDADNVLDGGKNNDTLIGGLGDDRYLIRAPGDTAVEKFDEGVDEVLAFRSYALEAHIEKLFMQTVYTKDGDPAIFNAIGNGVDNTIVGTPFANFIIGREGRDTLKGQAGADTFVFDRAIGPDNVDRIIDFNVNEAAEGDILFMKGSVFGGMAAGALDAGQFVAGTAAQDANDRFLFDQGSGRLWFDADGAGAGDQVLIATFEQDASVSAADIEVF
jgi:Ca2+-binding RTX toxin-like protein